jgi:hypothetical protein
MFEKSVYESRYPVISSLWILFIYAESILSRNLERTAKKHLERMRKATCHDFSVLSISSQL